jgi:restriction system protein
MANITYYDLLGLPSTATPAEIKAAYRRLSPKVHPDSGGTDALFHQVQEAYETLSDPTKRATYDRPISNAPLGAGTGGRAGRGVGWGAADMRRPPPRANFSNAWPPRPPPQAGHTSAPYSPPPWRRTAAAAQSKTGGQRSVSWLAQHRTAIVVAVIVLELGVLLGRLGVGLIALDFLAMIVAFLAMIVAFVAVLGNHRVRQREAYRGAGMAAIDAMTGTQFKCLLEVLFREKGYRVARVGGRGILGADLLLDSPRGRTVVQARRWADLVRHGAVQQVVAAKASCGATHAILITSSSFSDHAITLAKSNNVTLWDRATVAQELTALSNTPMHSSTQRFGSKLRAGVPILSSGLLAAYVTLTASSAGKKRRRSTPRHRRSRRRRHD